MTAIEQNDATRGPQAVGTSYYGVGGDSSIVQHIHLQWDASLIAVISFETSDFKDVSASTPSATAGDWITENPTTAYIATASGGGVAIANMTITIAGGTANGASVHVGNLGSRRLRVKVVCTQAGFLRIGSAGKE